MKKEIHSKNRREFVKDSAKIGGAIGISAILGHSLAFGAESANPKSANPKTTKRSRPVIARKSAGLTKQSKNKKESSY